MSERLDAAIRFACKAHEGQVRKVSATPYILHPLEAATVVGALTNDEDIIIAALLHDVVEDTPYTLEDVEKAFGSEVARLVASETENKRDDRPAAETWKTRKEESLEDLRNGDKKVKILWLGDKVSNARAFYRSYMELGDQMFERFNQKDKKEHEWYYRSVADATKEFYDTATHEELRVLIKKIFG